MATTRVVLEVVDTADFELKVPKRSLRAKQGEAAVYTVNAESLSGYTADINLTVTGLPTGATGTFGDSSLAYNGSTTLTVDTGTGAVGTYDITITGEEAA